MADRARLIEAVYEHGTFRPLQPVDLAEGQRVRLSVEPTAMTLAEAEAEVRKWHEVYEGLTEQEIAEIEAIALDRSHFIRRNVGANAEASNTVAEGQGERE